MSLPATIRYMRQGDDGSSVKDDGESRRKNRDQTTEEHRMGVLSARALEVGAVGEELSSRQLAERGFTCVPWRSSVAGELLSVQNPVIYRVEKTPETEVSRQVRERYIAEVEEMVRRVSGAKHFFTLHHACRYGKPNPQGVEYLTAYATFAHTDYTQTIVGNVGPMLKRRGISEAELEDLDVVFYNMWQPVANEVEQHPLALLHPQSLDVSDVRSVSLGYKVAPKGGDKSSDIHNKANEEKQQAPDVGQLVHNGKHQWYYYPRMTPDEILVFVQFDSRDPTKQVFHTAFWDETAPKEVKRRQSIELHAVATFPKKNKGVAAASKL